MSLTGTTDMLALNKTHDASAKSWVASANTNDSDFPIQNLPFCVFKHGGETRGGVAIGDQVFDLRAAVQANVFSGDALIAAEAGSQTTLNALMALPPSINSALRAALFDHLKADGSAQAQAAELGGKTLIPTKDVELGLPCKIEGYTDFLTSIHHTERHGKLKGLKDPLPPAFHSLPVAYHGRTSSILPSGTQVVRPNGQWKDADGSVKFGAVSALDFELELGALIGQGNTQGDPVLLSQAYQHLFGFCLLNDWSAKSIQWWEQVLGPFLGKNFHTSLSPWVVTTEALLPFRTAASPRTESAPPLLAHLHSREDREYGALDIELQARILTPRMRDEKAAPSRLTLTNAKTLYWTFGQMLAHHTSNGCNMQPGDLIGSGTISGVEPESMACMTEMTQAGTHAITLDNGEQRNWLGDGDEVIFTGRAQRQGYASIGFGECRGVIIPARPYGANA